MERKDWEKIIIRTIVSLTIAILIILHFDLAIKGISALVGFMSPIILGFVVAFVINVILIRLEKIYFPHTNNRFLKKSRRPVCIALALLIILAVIAFVIAMVIPELINAFSILAKEIPASYDSILDKISVFISKVPALENWLVTTLEIDLEHPRDIEWTKFFTKVVELIIGSKDGQLNSIMDSTVNIVSGIGSGIVSFCIALVFGIYVLAYKEKLSYQVHKLIRSYLKPKAENIIYYICHVASETFSNFIVGQCTEAVILGTLCIIGMSIFRFPYAVMIGTLVGATALIPIIGAYVGAIVGAIMVMTQGGPIQALLFIVFIIVLQQIEGNLIYPKVVGSSVGLPGIWVLAAVTIGGSMNGVFGMLLSVPLAATLYRLLKEDTTRRINKKNGTGETEIPDVSTSSDEAEDNDEDRDDDTQSDIEVQPDADGNETDPE
ncbi:MAG: AI-2E family transporter [Clostridium sp.]|nr:AI-2E family transporter [Clostridium sp.]